MVRDIRPEKFLLLAVLVAFVAAGSTYIMILQAQANGNYLSRRIVVLECTGNSLKIVSRGTGFQGGYATVYKVNGEKLFTVKVPAMGADETTVIPLPGRLPEGEYVLSDDVGEVKFSCY